MRKFVKNGGFTLIELLVVIAIIGILASVVLASLNTARQKSRDARRIADVKQIQNALELYYDSNSNVYPDALSALITTYIPVVPNDPSGGSYLYCQLSSGSYQLAANLETNHASLGSDRDLDTANCPATSGDDANILGDEAALGTDCANGTAGYCYDVTN